MTPSVVMDNIEHCMLIDLELSSHAPQSVSFGVLLAYTANFILRQLGVVLFASCRTMSALIFSIYRIIALGSQKQMTWVDAWWIIAFVADDLTDWNCSKMQYPREAMGACGSVVPAYDSITSRKKNASRPQPARRQQNRMNGSVLIYPFPESRFDGEGRNCVCEMPRKKTNRLTLNVARSPITRTSQRSFLLAATHAKTAWIGAIPQRALGAGRMMKNVVQRLTFYVAVRCIIVLRNLRFLSTTALTITIGNIERGIIGAHKKFTFLVSSLGRRKRRQALYIGGNHRSNYSMFCPVAELARKAANNFDYGTHDVFDPG